MTTLLRKPTGTNGKVHDITPATAGWGYVGFGLYRLVPGETVAEPTGDTEVILVLVEGRARIGAGERGLRRARRAHGRLRGHAAALRLRAERLGLVGDGHHRLHAGGLRRAGRGRPPGPGDRPDGIAPVTRGKGANTRHIHPIAMEERDVADSLWSPRSSPPRATGRATRRTGTTRTTFRA